MNEQRYPFGNYPYPVVENKIANDPTPKDQAIYVPSITPGYAMDVYAQRWNRALPLGVEPGDLNFLDPENKLFRISHALSSAGQALGQSRRCIITERDRANTVIIGDSGGYQIATGNLQINDDDDRQEILRWLEENADVAMTLDVPTGPVVKNPGYRFSSTTDCLAATLEHLEYFQKHRKSGKVIFLNMLQGNTPREAKAWYDAVKRYDFEGWAFAGPLRHNLTEFCTRILEMAHENQIQNKRRIHVLGTCELDTAVLLTALQRAINRNFNKKLRISFDTASPFLMLDTALRMHCLSSIISG
jgi:hypothetical protein